MLDKAIGVYGDDKRAFLFPDKKSSMRTFFKNNLCFIWNLTNHWCSSRDHSFNSFICLIHNLKNLTLVELAIPAILDSLVGGTELLAFSSVIILNNNWVNQDKPCFLVSGWFRGPFESQVFNFGNGTNGRGIHKLSSQRFSGSQLRKLASTEHQKVFPLIIQTNQNSSLDFFEILVSQVHSHIVSEFLGRLLEETRFTSQDDEGQDTQSQLQFHGSVSLLVVALRVGEPKSVVLADGIYLAYL